MEWKKCKTDFGTQKNLSEKGKNSIEICVLDIQYTNNGEECKNKCQKDGESYNWCWKISGSWDYCTPLALGKK